MRGGKTVTISGFILLLLLLMITYASNLFMRESTASNALTNAATSTTIDAAGLDETAPEFPESTTESVHKHSYSAYFINPSCTESGYTEYTCSCGDSFIDTEVEAHGHYYQLSETVEATCTDRGYNVYICDYCGDSYNWDYTTARGHDFKKEVFEATTEEQGYTLYTCKVCGYSHKDNFTDVKPVETEHTHCYTSEVVDPTCTAGGYTKYTCSGCGDIYFDAKTPASGHDYESIVTAPTCTADGYTTHTCTKCGDRYSDAKTEAIGHSYTSTIVEPTTDAEGYTQHTCSVCGYSYKDNYTEKLPAETEPTEPESMPCQVCGQTYDVTVVPPTTEEEGYTLYSCSRCGHSLKLNFVEKLPGGHVCCFTVSEVIEPTCNHGGMTCYSCECGEWYYADHTEALGHDFSEGDTCSRCGYSKESTVTLDYAAAIAYGNQYAAETYGWTIDLMLNADNAGFDFPYTASVSGVLSKGGQIYLNELIARSVDATYNTLASRDGGADGYRVNCDVYEYQDGSIAFYVYYG